MFFVFPPFYKGGQGGILIIRYLISICNPPQSPFSKEGSRAWPYRTLPSISELRHSLEGRGPVAFALKSVGWEKAWIPAPAPDPIRGPLIITKALAIFRRFSQYRTLFHHSVSGGEGGIRTHVPCSSQDNSISSRARYGHFGTSPQ